MLGVGLQEEHLLFTTIKSRIDYNNISVMHKIERTIKSVQALYLMYILRKGIISANHNSDINNEFVYFFTIVIKVQCVHPLPAICYPKQSHTVPNKTLLGPSLNSGWIIQI